ncbi:MAG TPA: hypothetical protein VGM30_13980 [Puia sp.]|jgi:hypothetical protein
MKKPLALAVCVIFAACNNNPTVSKTDSTTSAPDSGSATKTIQSPYDIMYSSKFVMDDPKNAESLLAIWKAYDNGDVSKSKDLFADTMTAQLADGSIMRASRDSMLAGLQTFRNSLKSAVDRVDAIMAIKSTDQNEHWALIWGTETDTYKNGKVDSTHLQETWRFNKDGKADLLLQYKRSGTRK